MGGPGSGRWGGRWHESIRAYPAVRVSDVRWKSLSDATDVTFRAIFENGAEASLNAAARAQPFGGQRWRFRCPRCGAPRMALYLNPDTDRLACRVCHRLCYPSQLCDPLNRWHLKMNKLESRLLARGARVASGGFPLRPKGMHRRTYWPIRDRLYTLNAVGWHYLALFVGKLTRRGQRRRKS